MRDDFDENTKQTLARRVGSRCSNPNCRKLTTGPQVDPKKSVNIGVAAHISAASPGGKRYNAGMSSQDRKSIDNGMWLCQNCAKLVDSDEKRYSVDLLNDWKRTSEHAALLEVENSAPLLHLLKMKILRFYVFILNALTSLHFKILSVKKVQWKLLTRQLKILLLQSIQARFAQEMVQY